MIKKIITFVVLPLFFSQFVTGQTTSPSGKSEWVHVNSAGKLEYKMTERGDRIMDFSHAGYMGGGVAIPELPVRITLDPTGKDDTGNIQAAIDKVSEMPAEGDFRGAVLLSPGIFNISSTITVRASGVVLRGSVSEGKVRSTILMSGKPFNAITIRQADKASVSSANFETQTTITDKYVPSGAMEFTVADARSFKKGDLIRIEKPVTSEWISFMQMHNLVRDGKPQTWIKEGSTLLSERRITNISGNKITSDVPLSDSYDMKFFPGGARVVKSEQSERLRNSGIEHLKIVSPLQPVSHSQPHFTALRINGEDCWARDILIEETMNSVGVSGKRITVENVVVSRKALHQGSSRPAEFAPNGTQVLIDRCKVIADNVWFVATGSGQAGPIVILNCEFIGDQRAESHQRWSTGMLYDNVRAENGGIDFRNRGSMGSGHGWSMGWGVAWNCVAKDFIIQNPPGACNWMIGCIGESKLMPRPFDKEPNLAGGIKDSPGSHVAPKSLYLAQLKERLGIQALINIGYK